VSVSNQALPGGYPVINKKTTLDQLLLMAMTAFREAMPPLTGRRNIRDFVACVGYGMLIGAIHLNEGTKLLYAAQVAYITNRPQSRFTKKSNTKVEQSGTQEAILEHTNLNLTTA
jgi:hypothetical protein